MVEDSKSPHLSREQSRAGRGLLDWSQSELAERAGLKGDGTVRHFESGLRAPSERSLAALRGALEKAGIEFIADGDASQGGGAGVRLAKRSKRVKKG